MRSLLLASAVMILGFASGAAAHDVPASFADLAARLLPSVVNVASTQPASSPGGDQSGGDQSGGDQSGGDQSGGNQPDGDQSGGGGAAVPDSGAGGGGNTAADAAPPLDKSFEQFLHSAQGPGSPDVTTGGDQMQSLGSGFIIDPSGLIVTNNHVIAGARSMSVILSDGTALPATLVGRDPQNDIALLRVHPPHPLQAVHFGASRKTRIGDWVIAIGNPYGLGGTVTAGIISARGRDLQEDGSSDYIQTDAAINRGNSGGPLFDMDGDVIGINTAIYSPSGGSVGIGFAIPSDEVAAVVDQLRLYGKPRHGWIGVQVMGVTPDIAAALKLPQVSGVVVATVAAGSPAASAHLRPGDVILDFGGHPVGSMQLLPRLVQESPVGQPVAVGYWRDGRAAEASMTVADEPAAPSPAARSTPPAAPAPMVALGLSLSDSDAGAHSQVQYSGRHRWRRHHRGCGGQRRGPAGTFSGRRHPADRRHAGRPCAGCDERDRRPQAGAAGRGPHARPGDRCGPVGEFHDRVEARPAQARPAQARPASGFQIGIPVEEVEPGLVQILARRMALREFVDLVGRGLIGRAQQAEAAFAQGLAALEEIVPLAAGHDIVPDRGAAAAAGNDMVEGQFLRRQAVTAILAAETVPQEDVVAGEGHVLALVIALERDDGGDWEGVIGRADLGLVIDDRADPVLQDGDQGILPWPDRKRAPAERLHVRIQHKGLEAGRNMAHRISPIDRMRIGSGGEPETRIWSGSKP